MNIKKDPLQTEEEFLWKVGQMIDAGKIENWSSINNIINKEILGDDEESYRTESAWRKRYQAARKFYENCFSKMVSNEDAYLKELEEKKRELERCKIQFRDERNAWQKQNYADARAEQKLNYLEEVLSNQGRVLFETHDTPVIKSDNDLLIQLSDLHIGQTFESAFGSYNTDIAKVRLEKYINEILEIQKRHNSQNAVLLLQGDLLSGNIHHSIQVTNRENVIDQIKIATELISSFCYELTKHFQNVQLYNVSGNHSRMTKKEDAIHDERLDDVVGWAVNLSLSHVNNFHYMKHRNVDTGIADINIRNKTYIAVHGDFDAYNKSGLQNLCMMLSFMPEAVLFGHMHKCSYNDEQGVKMIRSGSLAGCGDQYTLEKRLNGRPSQMVSVCNDYGVVCCYPIDLGTRLATLTR